MVTMRLKPKQPEKYDGSRDFQKIDNWIASMDSYFTITEAESPLIYHYLNTIFTDEAAIWFRYTYGKTNPSDLTWDTVKAALLNYFVRSNHLRRLHDQWAEARQTGTVTDYHVYLARLAMQLNTSISEEEFLDKFIRGLKPNTRTELEFHDPQTIAEAVKWASLFDAQFYHNKSSSQCYYGSFSTNSSYQEDNCGEPMQLDTLQRADGNTPAAVQIDAFRGKPQQFKLTKLTDEERTHLRNISACFKCRKMGHMARECPSKTNNNLGNSKRQ